MATPLEYNATIVERVDLTDALSIYLILPDRLPTNPWFSAGQYCVLGLNNLDDPALGSVRRSMSIASPPESGGPIEFYIRWVAKPESKNPLTRLLWRLRRGDRIYIRTVAAGVFTIADTIGIEDRRMRVLVASGTGVAPFVSMVRSEVHRNRGADLSGWVLLHGASRDAELGYRQELLGLSATNRLHYWGTISRPTDTSQWAGDVGRVEAFFETARLRELERRLNLGPDGFAPNNVVVYVCGLTGTITTTMDRLIERGFIPHAPLIREALGVPSDAKDSLFFELYDPAPLIDVKNPSVVQPLRARMRGALAKLSGLHD
jgi:ferredoxin--NADP+ reductase